MRKHPPDGHRNSLPCSPAPVGGVERQDAFDINPADVSTAMRTQFGAPRGRRPSRSRCSADRTRTRAARIRGAGQQRKQIGALTGMGIQTAQRHVTNVIEQRVARLCPPDDCGGRIRSIRRSCRRSVQSRSIVRKARRAVGNEAPAIQDLVLPTAQPRAGLALPLDAAADSQPRSGYTSAGPSPAPQHRDRTPHTSTPKPNCLIASLPWIELSARTR